MTDLIDTFKAALAAKSPATAASYLSDARSYMAHADAAGAPYDRRSVRAWLGSQEMSNVTRARKITAITALFSAAGLPSPQLMRPKLKSKGPAAISPTEALHAMEDISASDSSAERDRALLALLYGCGLHISEALSLNVGDVSADTLHIGSRTIPIMGAVRAAIDVHVAANLCDSCSSSPLFLGARGERLDRTVAARLIRQFRQRVGLPAHVTAKTFRHSFAVHMLEGGADVRSLQELLGHTSMVSTVRYVGKTAKLMKEFDKAHSRGQNA